MSSSVSHSSSDHNTGSSFMRDSGGAVQSSSMAGSGRQGYEGSTDTEMSHKGG